MSAHVLLNLLNESGEKRYNARLAKFFISSIKLYRSTNIRFYLSYDIKITLKTYNFTMFVIMYATLLWMQGTKIPLVHW